MKVSQRVSPLEWFFLYACVCVESTLASDSLHLCKIGWGLRFRGLTPETEPHLFIGWLWLAQTLTHSLTYTLSYSLTQPGFDLRSNNQCTSCVPSGRAKARKKVEGRVEASRIDRHYKKPRKKRERERSGGSCRV